MRCNPFLLQMRHLRSCSFRYQQYIFPSCFSEIRQGQRETLLSVAVRACMDLCLFFAPARVYAHELGNLLRRLRV